MKQRFHKKVNKIYYNKFLNNTYTTLKDKNINNSQKLIIYSIK